MSNIPFLLLIFLIILLIILSGFFSISETSMMALNRYKLRYDAKNKNRAAITTQKLLKSTDKLLGVILLGNNLVNSGAAARKLLSAGARTGTKRHRATWR